MKEPETVWYCDETNQFLVGVYQGSHVIERYYDSNGYQKARLYEFIGFLDSDDDIKAWLES